MSTPGGVKLEIFKISSSLIIPGQLGISPTNPKISLPYFIAKAASSIFEMQQILTFGRLRFNFFKEDFIKY